MIEKSSEKKPSTFRLLDGWSRLFLEMLVITFGVLMAFGLNAWWESRNQAAFDRISLSQIYDEIDRNYDTISEAYTYRLKLYPQMLAVERQILSVSEIQFQGTRPPRLETAAYDLALTSGVFARIEPEKAQTLIKAYINFENIDKVHHLYGNSLPSLVLEMDGPNDPKFVKFMQMAFMDMIFAEGETLVYVSSFTEKPEVIQPWEAISEATKSEVVQSESSD